MISPNRGEHKTYLKPPPSQWVVEENLKAPSEIPEFPGMIYPSLHQKVAKKTLQHVPLGVPLGLLGSKVRIDQWVGYFTLTYPICK